MEKEDKRLARNFLEKKVILYQIWLWDPQYMDPIHYPAMKIGSTVIRRVNPIVENRIRTIEIYICWSGTGYPVQAVFYFTNPKQYHPATKAF